MRTLQAAQILKRMKLKIRIEVYLGLPQQLSDTRQI